MEGKGLKSLIVVVLILGLVLEQTQVEAKGKYCCDSYQHRDDFKWCISHIKQKEYCFGPGTGCALLDKCTSWYYLPAGDAVTADVSDEVITANII
ncbi:unnamed protein product [Urochloa decumbens]|uniref:Uncharacterized protein n=1 Tax=Urochloa decumbens TaxID=240449 RepID=A0ABC9B4G7_9POAL